MLEFLPQNVKDGMAHLNLRYVYELRLRAQKPVRVNYAGEYRYLGAYGIVEHLQKAIVCDMEDIADCLFKAGRYSIYSVEEQMKKGFITGENGERIGIAGEYVFEKGQPLAIRNVTALCIRVPHEIYGAGEEIYNGCMSDKVRSVLIMSSPGLGKTTILRDLARILCEKTKKNLLICDERGEISMGDTGLTSDVMKFSDKATAFESGIRALRPEVIITDELSLQDCEAVKKAIFAGVSVIASAHFLNFDYLPSSFRGIFERYVVLGEGAMGCVQAIYDADGRRR